VIQIDDTLTPEALRPALGRMWDLSAAKIRALDARYDPNEGAPVYTVEGRYTARGWTEWTQGFQFGAAILQFDATGDTAMLDLGRARTRARMHPHVTHFGVHDHGFNNVSTYGALLRLMHEGRIPENEWERDYYRMALLASGSVQARRWTDLGPGEDGRREGYVYSFNGPQSLFVDTIRSMRSLALAHTLGGVLGGEHDEAVSLLDRLAAHARATAKYSVYYGEGRDGYDVRGRTVHEAIFNLNDGFFRCPSTQQGYSPVTTWTRGLAWALLGCTEEWEWLGARPGADRDAAGDLPDVLLRAATATADFYLAHTPTDGVPYWDTGAPGLHRLGDYLDRPSDPYNDEEPVDSSAAAIAAQGLLRLGRILGDAGTRYTQAGLTVLRTLLNDPYLSTDAGHEGLLLHAVYHWPNRWDHVPEGRKVASGESCMWGDYHLRELGLYVQRLADGGPYYTFFGQ
jgi:unsaturated chondroitin disaccharide hydrolase